MRPIALIRIVLLVMLFIGTFFAELNRHSKRHWIQSSSEFQLVKGVYATDLNGVQEGYRVGPTEVRKGERYTTIEVNVSAPHLLETFVALTKVLDQKDIQNYFYLEIPETRDERAAHPANERNSPHSKVYYIDSPSYAALENVVRENAEVLLNNGFVVFGLGSNVRKEEVGVEDYKLILIRTSHPDEFAKVLDQLRFRRTDHLKTVGQTITPRSPVYVENYQNAHELQDLVAKLQKQGLYYYETRAE